MAHELYVRFEPRFSFILAHYFAIPKEMVDLAHRLGEQFNTKQRWWDKDKSLGGRIGFIVVVFVSKVS